MKPLRIDFAPRSVRRFLWQLHPAVWILTAAGMLACASAAFAVSGLLTQRDMARSEYVRLHKKLAGREAVRPQAARLNIPDAQAAAVNSAVAQLNIPWRDVLDVVEAATPATIALISLEPDSGKHLVAGVAEARDSDAMIGYIEQLKRQDFFGDVILTRHETNAQDPNRPLRFHFTASWSESTQ